MKKNDICNSGVCRTGRYDERPAPPRRRKTKVLGVSEKVSAIDAYVRSVETNISSSQRKEQMLSPGELKKRNERELDEDPYLL